jgi:hypothetical protein
LELDLFVLSPSIFDSGFVDLNAVIDNQVNGAERIDLRWVSSQSGDRVSHGSQIDHCWHSSEILKDDSSRLERDFDGLAGELFPVQDVLDVLGSDFEFIAVSDCAFEEDSDAER